jgi:hypothetical protein
LLALALYGLVAATLLGGCIVLLNLLHTGGIGMSSRTFQNRAGPMYGDYDNLWKFPVALLLAPFSSGRDSLWVPWSSEPYWWSESDLNLSHFGGAFSLALLALPVIEWRRLGRDSRFERWAGVAVLGLAFASLLPLRVRPVGFFILEARYYLAILPVVFAWAAGGCGLLYDRAWVVSRVGHGPLVGLAGAWLTWNAAKIGRTDSSHPLAFVVRAALSDEAVRSPPVQIFHRRVGYLVDAVVGPREVVAVDAAHDTWLYPMFGRDFLRPVRFIAASATGPVTIPGDAAWVAIDRGHQEFFFGHPELTELRISLLQKYWGKGKPAEEHFRVLRQLEKDPEWVQVYRDDHANQALFRRK